jgi:hypothetical protein
MGAGSSTSDQPAPLVPDAPDAPEVVPAPPADSAPSTAPAPRRAAAKKKGSSKKAQSAPRTPADSSATSQPDGLCAVAYANAQKDEGSGQLREARDLLLTCAKPTCGTFLYKECTARYTQLGNDIPSVVPLADKGGVPIVDARVTMDGALLASRLVGQAFPVDPGLHEFAFSTDGGVFATQKVMIAAGQRNRPISASIHSAVSMPVAQEQPGQEQPKKARRSAVPYLLGSAGLAGVGAGALLVYWGRKDNEALGQCSPSCSESSLDHIHTLYLAGDIAMGAGVAALGLATWRFFATPHFTGDDAPARPAATGFDVQPTRSGAFASVSRSF